MIVAGAVITAICLNCQINRHELCGGTDPGNSHGGFPIPDCSCTHASHR